MERPIRGGAIPVERIRLTFVGHAKDFGFRELEERGTVRRLGCVDHDEAIARMKEADVLLALEPGNSEGIERELLRLCRGWGSGTLACRSHPKRVARYSQRETVRQLAKVIDDVLREAATLGTPLSEGLGASEPAYHEHEP